MTPLKGIAFSGVFLGHSSEIITDISEDSVPEICIAASLVGAAQINSGYLWFVSTRKC